MSGETTLFLGSLVLKIAAVQVLVLELLASIIGRLWPEAWLARFSRLIRFLHSCFAPARWLLEGTLRPLALPDPHRPDRLAGLAACEKALAGWLLA